MLIRRISGKVLFPDQAGLSRECNVLAHPRLLDYVVISEKASLQHPEEGFMVKWSDIENLNATTREEAIENFTKYWFTKS